MILFDDPVSVRNRIMKPHNNTQPAAFSTSVE